MDLHLSLSGENDSELIKHLKKAGAYKRMAEDELFKKYMYFIREGINKYSISSDEAFDAYSDTVLTVIDTVTRGTFENRSSLKTYIYRIFHNKCIDAVRKKTTNKSSVNKTSPVEDLLSKLSDSAKSVLQKIIDKTEYDAIKAKLDQLGDACKKILLQFADGSTDKEIAVEMNYKSADVVKTTRLRCLEKLRNLYKPL